MKKGKKCHKGPEAEVLAAWRGKPLTVSGPTKDEEQLGGYASRFSLVWHDGLPQQLESLLQPASYTH
jgi:hypothetical protein